jgi:hypothetical protein
MKKGEPYWCRGSPFFWISKQYLRVFREADFQDQLEESVPLYIPLSKVLEIS